MSMRIVGGKLSGRRLLSPNGPGIRPTSDKVRGAIMNILRSRGAIDFAVVLDVFCGTGALGIEALSQGAQSCTFIDNSQNSLGLCRMNIEKLDLKDKSAMLKKDAADLGEFDGAETATLVFLDPPYRDQTLLPAALKSLAKGWLKNGAILVAEISKDYAEGVPRGYELLDQKGYGDTKIMLLRYDKTPL